MIFQQTADDRKVHSFSLSESFLDQFKGKQPKWGPVGYFTYKRTYARPLEGGGTEEWNQTVQRVVEGCYTIQKIHCRRMGLPWNGPKAQKSAQDMYERIFGFQFTPPGRGLWVMGTDLIYERGSAALQNCFAGETEIITGKGVKKIGDLSGTTQTLLTKGGKWVQAPIKSFGRQKLWEITLGRQGIEKKIFATKDHRWFVLDRSKPYRKRGYVELKTQELRSPQRLQYIFGQGVKGSVTPSPFGIAHGFVYGDGRTSQGIRNANSVPLIGEKDSIMETFFHLCPCSKRPDGVEFGAIPNYFRELPSIEENKSYLLGWLMGYFAADGSCSRGVTKIDSHRRSDIEFVRDVCAVLGIGTYAIRKQVRTNEWARGGIQTIYSLCLMRDTIMEEFFLVPKHKESYLAFGGDKVSKRHWMVKEVVETSREEEVFCATVEGFGAFALEGNILTGNCAFVSSEHIEQDFAGPFCFLMDMSMHGVGVGGDTRGAGSIKLQSPRTSDSIYTVEDSREGWVELTRTVLNSFAGKGAFPLKIDYTQVRGKGALIKKFGGVASGPAPLQKMIEGISKVLLPEGTTVSWKVDQNKEAGKIYVATAKFKGESEPTKITGAQIVDIFNYIGKCVVSGGVRRTAEIMYGDIEDKEFLSLKQDKEALDERRWASNNSVFAEVGSDYGPLVEAVSNNGEPGIMWLENGRQFSRMQGPPDNKDRKAMGSNPCGEQTLNSYELCNLVETFPHKHETYEDFERTLKMAYLYAKTVTLVPTHDQRANAVMTRNRRIGCSMSGIVQAIEKLGRRVFLEWCDKGYKYIQELDREYSDWLGIPLSIKTTSVKPSGTVSLLTGSTAGIHYPHSEYYIRNIRVADTSPLVQACMDAGYPVNPDPQADDTSIVSFPIHEEFFHKGKSDVTVWEQFANAADMQRHWADNQVSITVTFKKEEVKDLKTCLEFFEDHLKGVSMLPLRDEDHHYQFAPYQEITEEQFHKVSKGLKPIDMGVSGHEVDDNFCDGGKCEIPS